MILNANKKLSLLEKKASGPDIIESISLVAPGEEEVGTYEILKASAVSALTRNEHESRAYEWCDVFSRKFEIARKLKKKYGKDLKPADENETEIGAYCFLSLLCCLLAEDKNPNLRYLNAALKANDLLIYNIDKINEPAEITAMKQSLVKELKIVDDLCKSKNILCKTQNC